MQPQILRSTTDRSINYITPSYDGGAIEARFVQRLDDTIICYVSSASGCRQLCRMCHLTATRQFMETPVDMPGYVAQVKRVLAHAKAEGRLAGVTTLHINWMARGDPLANPHFIRHTKGIIGALSRLASYYGLAPKFKISTIFPKTKVFGTTDAEIYRNLQKWVDKTLLIHPEIELYYSLYSLDTAFRKRWLPKAMDPSVIGRIFSGRSQQIRIHHALIDGLNDTNRDVLEIRRWLDTYQITCRLNLVQFNPPEGSEAVESSPEQIAQYISLMKTSPRIIDVHQIVPVGKDVHASCGTFAQ